MTHPALLPKLRAFAAVALAAAAVGLALPLHAGVTDPYLMLLDARASVGQNATVLRLEAVFPIDDLDQGARPVQLLLSESGGGTGFWRFDLFGGTYAGASPLVADGVDSSDAAALANQGSSSTGGVVYFGANRIDLRLPDDLPPGSYDAVLFAIYPPDATLSNAFPVVVP